MYLRARLILSMLAVGIVSAQAVASDYFNGFETDTSDWYGGVTRAASGTGGITAADGSYYGSVSGGAYTYWGGKSPTWPSGGFTTSLDIYLNMSGGWANDTRFDWDNSVNDSSGNFLRDFVFNGGFYNDSDSTGSGDRFVFSASNNTGRGNAFPKNFARDPFSITTTGWYTFQDRFYDNGGVLAVDLSILDSSANVLHTWTLSNPGDLIGNVGGNRYGWFATQEFSSLAIDNARRNSPETTPEPITLSLGLAGIGLFLRRRSSRKSL